MCSQSKLNSILSKIAEVAKNTFGNTLQAVILYGSYARGDYDDASDIDIMIILNELKCAGCCPRGSVQI